MHIVVLVVFSEKGRFQQLWVLTAKDAVVFCYLFWTVFSGPQTDTASVASLD
jgi:hypothetical protein